jgi:probable phosphoglycerate mutase
LLSLHLLRHGETEFSRQDRFCGDIDADLTEAGHRMAEAFAASYGGRPLRFTAVYTSTRRRTLSTAAPLARRTGMTAEPREELNEMSFGEWQGRSKVEIAASDPARFRRWIEDPTTGAPAGESVADVVARATRIVEEIRLRHGRGDVLAVAHKTILRLLICALLGIDLRQYRDRIVQPVCGLTVIDFPRGGAAVLRSLADLSHLPPDLHARALASALPSPQPSSLSETRASVWPVPDAAGG